MTTSPHQEIVEPSRIEPQLIKLWEGQGKDKVRACLFNLIVFNRLSGRTDYIRSIVQKVSEKFPCRVLFITSDPDSKNPYLKTAVSVVGGGNIACDYIDIGVSGPDIERVPFILFPHFIPDLPISLLWTEDPVKPHPLFKPLAKLSHRLIFDSESSDTLLSFAQAVSKIRSETKLDTADLNWARTRGWRELIASLFHSGENIEDINHVEIIYNARPTEFFCHLKVQSMYLLAWISSRLKWNFKEATKDLHFTFESQTAKIISENWDGLGSGTVISVNIYTKNGYSYELRRIKDRYHYVLIKTSSPEKCELPYQYVLGKTATGQTLAKEIVTKGTSAHYLEMLNELTKLDKDNLC